MYEIFLLPQAKKDLDKFKGKIFHQIVERILALKNNTRPQGCVKLTGEEGYRLRSGRYRMIYRIDDKKNIVYIYRVKHRKEAY